MKDDIWVRRVENGFVVTIGIDDADKLARQYVARDFEQLCEIMKELMGDE
jgi:hypothetical protein